MRPEDELRAAWEQLDAPDPSARADDLASTDRATRAAVSWLARAYRSLEVPAPQAEAPDPALRAAYEALPVPPCPMPRAGSLARRPARVPHRRAVAAVALLAAAAVLALVLRSALEPSAPEHTPERVAQALETTPAPPLEPTVDRADPTLASAASPSPGIPAQVTPNGLELRSGPVRLLLLAPSSHLDSSSR